MEVLFENKTRFSEKTYNIFLKAYREEYALSDNLYMLFNLGFFGLCMIMAFIEKEIILGLLLLVGLGVYLWYKIIRPAVKEQKTRSSSKIKGNFMNTYKFYKNYFDVSNPEGEARTQYSKMYKVVETKEYYYIYISRENAFIVSKIGFSKGTAIDFSKFIKKKAFGKYKKRIK